MDLTNTAISVVILTIVVAIAGSLLASVKAQQTANSVAANVSEYGLQGMLTYGSWIGIIVLVTVAGFIIAYLKGAFQ